MTGGGAAIDNGRPSHPQAEQCLLISPGLAWSLAWAGELVRGHYKGCGGVGGGSLPVKTNGYEEPPYLLTLKRIRCPLSNSCLPARTALTVMLWGWEGSATVSHFDCMWVVYNTVVLRAEYNNFQTFKVELHQQWILSNNSQLIMICKC